MGEAVVIVARKKNKWNIAEGEYIIVYRGGEILRGNIGENIRTFKINKNILNYE